MVSSWLSPSFPTCLSQLSSWGWHEGTRYIVHTLQWKQGGIHTSEIRMQGPGLVKVGGSGAMKVGTAGCVGVHQAEGAGIQRCEDF